MQSSFWITSNNPNFSTNTSILWSNGEYQRKRKVSESDFEEKSQHKMFVTEEKLVKNMRTLSLDLSVNNNDSIISQIAQQDEGSNENNNLSQQELQFELHQLLKDNLRRDDLQDNLINKLYDLERKKLSMQIVPYMPIHPAQLNNNNNNNNNHSTIDEKKQENQNKIKKENDDHLFKKPFIPTPYTVEEPCENLIKRTPRMKRSYSQSMRSNSNLSVVELKNDINDSSFCHSQSDYFIFEPTTPVLIQSSTSDLNSSYSSNRPSIRITEYFDFSSSNTTDDIDMQPIVLSDVNEKMDDDDDNI